MLLEHLVYTLAISLVVGAIYHNFTSRDPSWIMMISCVVPDIDYIPYRIFYHMGIHPEPIVHGSFHNVIALVIFSLIGGYLLMKINVPFKEGVLFFSLGIISHFIEDAIVYQAAYKFLYPFSNNIMGWGILNETEDIFGLAGVEVLIPGILLLSIVVCARMMVDTDWSIIKHSITTSNQFKYCLNILLNTNPLPVDENE